MTHAAITLAFAVSVLWVLYWLIDGLVRWWNAVGDALRPVPSCFRTEPASPFSQSDIAIAGGSHGCSMLTAKRPRNSSGGRHD